MVSLVMLFCWGHGGTVSWRAFTRSGGAGFPGTVESLLLFLLITQITDFALPEQHLVYFVSGGRSATIIIRLHGYHVRGL